MTLKCFDDLWKEAESQNDFWKKQIILDFTIELNKLMKKRGISKSEFAQIIGKSQAYVTKVFRGNANFTIETMVKLSRALDGQLDIHVSPKENNIQAWFARVSEPQGKPKVRKKIVWAEYIANNITQPVKAGNANGYSSAA